MPLIELHVSNTMGRKGQHETQLEAIRANWIIGIPKVGPGISQNTGFVGVQLALILVKEMKRISQDI